MSKISRAMAVLCLLPVLAAAQLKQPANFPVVKVGKTEFSRGKIDSMATQLLTQQYRGKQAPQEAVAQMRLFVVEIKGLRKRWVTASAKDSRSSFGRVRVGFFYSKYVYP